MFWGLIMEPLRKYSQKVKKSFHVSMAALDITTAADNEPTQVICSFDNRNYLLCTLQKDKAIQVPLDLNFEVDDTVCFATNGKANIHLTGYLTDEFSDLDDTGDLDDIEDTEEEESLESVPRKRQAAAVNSSPPKKKSKTLELLSAVDSQKEDTDSDDSDFNMSTNDEGLDTTQAEEEEDDEDEQDDDEDEAEEEESEDEEDESDDEEDDDDDEEASSLSDNEEVEKPKSAKMNGVPKMKGQKQSVVKKESAVQSPVSQKEKKPKTSKSEKVQQQQKGEKTPKDESKTPGKATKAAKEENKAKTPKSPAAPQQSPTQKKSLEGGVIIEDLKPGNGPIAKTGRVVQVYYEGRFKNNNKMFDSTTKGPGFKFRLGKQEVIKGWDVGVVGMKVGGKRRITCPPNMAYGQKGSPPAIPPNSTLVFEVELKNVN